MSKKHVFALTAFATCACVACGVASERRAAAPSEVSSLPAVSAGAARDAGRAREVPAALSELPPAPAAGPALLEPEGRTTPRADAAGLPAVPRAAEAPAPRIVLDDPADDLGVAILGSGLGGERLALPEDADEPAAEDPFGAAVEPPLQPDPLPVPGAFE